jgi:hypothetical protein
MAPATTGYNNARTGPVPEYGKRKDKKAETSDHGLECRPATSVPATGDWDRH